MTQEEKQLLFQDLCGRLPYNTMITVNDGKYRKDVKLHPHYIFDWDAERWDAKPYLRSMSSMTEEEREELFQIWKLGKENGSESVTKLLKEIFYKAINENYILKLATSFENWIDVMTWFNKHHFDYRGLIEKGLAIEAPKDMYVVKN